MAQALHLVDGVLDECLSAESGVDAHQQHHIHILDDILKHTHGRRGIERHACLHAGIVYLLYRAVQVGACLIVHVHHHRTEFGGLLDILLGVHYHEMHVESLGAFLCHGLEHRETEGYVWHEHSIHHVEMQPLCLTAVYHFNVAVEMQKICCQQRG